MLFSWYSFVELGCPKSDSRYEPAGGFRLDSETKRVAVDLLAKIRAFSPDSVSWIQLPLEGGKQAIHKMLSSCDNYTNYNKQQESIDIAVSKALPVKPSRIAVPAVAGTVNPASYLCAERQAVLNDLQKLRLPETDWRFPITRACHRVAPCDENDLVRLLLNSRMAALVHEDELPRTASGDLLIGGFSQW